MPNPNRKNSLPETAAAVVLAAALGTLAVITKEKHDNTDPGRPQIDPNPPVERVSHPLPFYESDKGPDGKIDFFAHKTTPAGTTSYKIDGGTPAPAPEHREK